MQIVCLRCGEPWDVDYIMDIPPLEKKDFTMLGVMQILACPCCKGLDVNIEPELADKLSAMGAVADVLGDDIDGYANFLQDEGLV